MENIVLFLHNSFNSKIHTFMKNGGELKASTFNVAISESEEECL